MTLTTKDDRIQENKISLTNVTGIYHVGVSTVESLIEMLTELKDKSAQQIFIELDNNRIVCHETSEEISPEDEDFSQYQNLKKRFNYL